ncbi:MAG TPA: GDSL-type esterase/lipase family protein [Planctomycetota bacterium]|nr:GDSL-type esterase/lipase family protein [Planctomycetota bacterium]
MKRALIAAAVLVLAGVTFAQDGTLFDMDTVVHKPTEIVVDAKTKAKGPCATLELVDGKFGKAVKFTFIANARGGFCTKWHRADASWDEAAGISFWVKGDGSASWGGLELIDQNDYALRYGYCFPIDSTEWRKITVPWCDLVPELPKGDLVDVKTGYKPSGFGNVWFGKWFYWKDYPAHSYTIDQVQLEKTIDADATDYTPAAAGLSRFLAKLEAGKPVTIVTMGDSLSDKAHWANRAQLWSEMLVAELEKKYKSKVTLVNPAIGGTQLSQNLVLMPRWLKDHPECDLVTVWFGYNDWDGGMRGEHFEKLLRFAVDRIRRMTKGRTDVLLMTTCPANKRWHDMDELAEAVRKVAKEKKTGLADVAAEFHKIEGDEADTALKLNYWAWDRTHLGEKGHEITRDVVLDAIEQGK